MKNKKVENLLRNIFKDIKILNSKVNKMHQDIKDIKRGSAEEQFYNERELDSK